MIATTMRERKFGDNPKFILEELKKELPKLDFVWLVSEKSDAETPSWIRTIPYHFSLKTIYEISTAHILIF